MNDLISRLDYKTPAEVYYKGILELAGLSKTGTFRLGLTKLNFINFLSRQPSVAYNLKGQLK